jgi:hypothetical protein
MSIEAGRQDERLDSTLALKLEHGEGVVRNVSANGIYFVTDVALKNGAPVKFTVEFRNFPGGPIQVDCIARIVRVDEQGEKRGVAASISSFEFCRVRKPGDQRS